METVGTRIKALRIERGWTQAQLADAICQRTRAMVAKYELGTAMPPDGVMEALADVFGVTAEFLRTGRENDGSVPAFAEAKQFRINGRPTQRCSVLLYPGTLARVKVVAKQHGISVAEAMDQIVTYAINNLAN